MIDRPIDLWREEHGPTPCAGHHRAFFPWDGEIGHSSVRVMLEAEAKAICSDCPAIIPCAQSSVIKFGRDEYCEPGIWAGRDQVERCRATGLPPVPGTGTKWANQVAARARRGAR